MSQRTVPIFTWPLDQHHVVRSVFTDARDYGLHSAIDLVAPTGTPIHPIAPGAVIFAGYAGTCGKGVWIAHADGWRSHNCHLDSIFTTHGQKVTPADIIGYVGVSGAAGYPHLHLNLFAPYLPLNIPSKYIPWVGKWAVDPLAYLSGARPPPPAPTYYTVVSGDIAGKIAERYGLTIYRTKSGAWGGTFVILNPGQPRSGNWNLIYPGERFRVK